MNDILIGHIRFINLKTQQKLSKLIKILVFTALIASFSACNLHKGPDVSNIDVQIKIKRFDLAMDSLSQANLSTETTELRTKFPDFYDDYMKGMLEVGNTDDEGYLKNLGTVLQNKDYLSLSKETARVFADMGPYERTLSEAFKHVKYYYPKTQVPRLISFISGFAVQVPIGNDYLGIGLDMFLGADSKFYPALRQSIPEYIYRRFTPDNIAPRVMETFVRETLFTEKQGQTSFLDRMIYNGKVMYAMSLFMPDAPDSLLIGYTQKQMEWADRYRADIWGYFLQENLLYETDYMKIQKYLSEAPFTPGLGENNESAPKLGIYTGWQIVKKYMEEHPEISLPQLLNEPDAQKILNGSHYKPKG